MSNPPKIQQGTPLDALDDKSSGEAAQAEPSFAQKIIQQDEAQAARAKQTAHDNLTQTLRSGAQQKASQYQSPETRQANTDTAQTFGRKINVNAEVARQAENPLPEGARAPQRPDNFSGTPQPRSKPLPQPPTPQDFSQVLQSRVFQGPLQNGATQQKLQQQFLTLQTPQPPAGGTADALSKSEILQLFSMRLRSDLNKEEREALRRLIRFEAAVANLARDRVRSIQYQTESGHRKENVDAMIQAEKAERQDSVHRDLLDRLAHSAESLFERILQKVLGQNRSAVGDLPEGDSPDLPVKDSGEWQAFYERVTNLESELVAASASNEDVKEILYRGLLQSDGQTKLISDLALQQDGDLAQHKFAQLLLADPNLLNLLQSLKPGQRLPAEFIKALGEQVLFLKLVNVTAGAKDLSEMEKQELLRKFRSEISTGYQGALEKAMRDKRAAKPQDPFVWAGDQFDKKEERRGLQTFLLYLLYFTLAVGLGALLIFILQNLF